MSTVATTNPDDPFANTRWSVVLAARDPQRATLALEELCRLYWFPLYSYVRRRGHAAPAAQDLTQMFFARLLEKSWLDAVEPERGRFRAFLLAAMKRFLANEWDRENAQKRGGGTLQLSLDAETRYQDEVLDELSPENLFDRQWALALLDTVLSRLRAEHEAAGKLPLFEALRTTLTGEQVDVGYVALGRQLGLNEGAVKVAVHRLRKRYRELLRAEIAQTLSDPAQVDDELQALFAALRG